MKYIYLIAALFLLQTTAFSQTQQEMNKEAAEKYRAADAELNKAYKELIALIGPTQKKQLVKAQRAWITYRDAHCKFAGSFYAGGSMQSLVLSQCRQEVTGQRTKELKASIEELKSR